MDITSTPQSDRVPRVGLLVIGLAGGNGSALSAALAQLRESSRPVDYGISSLPIFRTDCFPDAADIVLGGWDVRHAEGDSLLPNSVARGLWGSVDTELGDERDGTPWPNVQAAADHIERQIQDFKRSQHLSNVIVLNMSSPARRLVRPLVEWSEQDVLATSPHGMPSAVPYAIGALRAGASFIDFTPSETLEWVPLWQMAFDRGLQLAGRDGSTGQTFLKSLIAAALEMRGLHVASWYSTNILGNRDGAVLMIPGVDVTKQADKAHAIESMTDLAKGEHLIDIRYVAELGDFKEAWDSVVAHDFLGNQIELRINWKAEDSPLAAQLALDLVRMVAAGNGHHAGLRRDLALFFKHPVGGVVPRSPMEHFNELLAANEYLLKEGADRSDLRW